MIYLRLQTCWNGFISILNMLVDIATNMNTCSTLLGWDLESHGQQLKVLSLDHVFLAFDFHPMCYLHVWCIHKFNSHMLHLLPLLHLYNLTYNLMYDLFKIFFIFYITIVYSWYFMKLLGFRTSIALILRETWINST